MASNPKMEYQVFPSLAKLNWDNQLGKLFSLPSQRSFPISFKPKLAIARLLWKMQEKTWYSILGLDAEPLFLQEDMLSKINKVQALCLWMHVFLMAPKEEH